MVARHLLMLGFPRSCTSVVIQEGLGKPNAFVLDGNELRMDCK